MELLITTFTYLFVTGVNTNNLFIIYIPMFLIMFFLVFHTIRFKENYQRMRQIRLTLLYLSLVNATIIGVWCSIFPPSANATLTLCPITLIDLVILPVLYYNIIKVDHLMSRTFAEIYKWPFIDFLMNIMLHSYIDTMIIMSILLCTLMILELYPLYVISVLILTSVQSFILLPFTLGYLDNSNHNNLKTFWCGYSTTFTPEQFTKTQIYTGYSSLRKHFIQRRQYHTTIPSKGFLQQMSKGFDKALTVPTARIATQIYNSYITHPEATRFARNTIFAGVSVGLGYKLVQSAIEAQKHIKALEAEEKALDNDGKILDERIIQAQNQGKGLDERVIQAQNQGKGLDERVIQAQNQGKSLDIEYARLTGNPSPSRSLQDTPTATPGNINKLPVDGSNISDESTNMSLLDGFFDLLTTLIDIFFN